MDGNHNFIPVANQWFLALPPITRTWLVATVLVTALSNLDVIGTKYLYLHEWSDIWRTGSNIQAWRMVTCFLYAGKFGWGTLINLHLMSQISGRYEAMGPICTRVRLWRQHDIHDPNQQSTENNRQRQPQQSAGPQRVEYFERGELSDYAFALLLGSLGILLSNFFLLPYVPTLIVKNQQYVFFHRHLTFFVVYIWSKQHSNRNVNFFGVEMMAAYLPYAYLVMGYALNNGDALPLDMLHGMFVGHVYYYLACVVPKILPGKVVIVTPIWLVDFCYWLEGRRFGADGLDGNNPMIVDTDGTIGG